MREILFRGKLVYNGWWVEGGFYKEPKDDIKDGLSYIITASLSYAGNAEQVHPETVGQFTGLLDKNGKKIFEGDIYVTDYNQHTLKNNVQVLSVGGAFCGGKTCLRCSPLAWDSKEDDEELYLDEEFLNHVVVIGNIHDNPELLEAK